MSQLRSDYIDAAETGTTRSTTVKLGTSYPTRILFVNGPPPQGRIHTEMPSDGTISANGFSASRVCGLNSPVKSRSITFNTEYNHLSDSEAPPYIFENSVLYRQTPDGNVLFESDQLLVQGSTLNLYPLTSNMSHSGIGGESIDFKSAETGEIEVSGSISVTIPTTLSDEQWEELLKNQPNFDSAQQVGSQRVKIILSDASWTVQCAAVGAEQTPDVTDPPQINPETGETDGVGRGGESTYPETKSETISTKGGLWKNITEVNALNISEPRFSPTRAGDGELNTKKWSLRTVLGIKTANSDTQYFIDVGEKKGLQFDASKENPEWQNKELTVIRRSPDGEGGWEITKAETKINETELSLKDFRDGAVFNPLNLKQVQAGAGSNYANLIYEIRNTLDSSSDSELFVADHHGRILATLGSTEYPTATGNEFLAADDGAENTKPKAVQIESGAYSGAKIGIINTRDVPIDSITEIDVTVTSSDVPTSVSAEAYSSRDRGSYGSEVYFDGDTTGYINNSFDLGQTEDFTEEGGISGDSAVVLKFSEFTDENSDPVDMAGERIELTITFEANGKTYTDTIRATLDSKTTT